jgi:hypothetical protein
MFAETGRITHYVVFGEPLDQVSEYPLRRNWLIYFLTCAEPVQFIANALAASLIRTCVSLP